MAFVWFFGVLGGACLLLIVTLMRRNGRRTETAEGLRIEEQARIQAHEDRVSYNSLSVHSSMPTAGDAYQRRR
ncbi:hypothetical protein [Streptomyces roseicoloratus]|uniref:Uncharacterized protein n=1 Tax=Streptomyces roseicoloratus TaxID=2508722 RepID=A0ABY9RQT2_9ACTN|nr:hypothetical protein [Streptomyces roseicoloratus]WMX44531.1 hypothetical protein RGF97_06180 [Streptomyces roseicoloratus]